MSFRPDQFHANREPLSAGTAQITGEQPLELREIGILSQVGANHQEKAAAAEAPQNDNKGLSPGLQQVLGQILEAELATKSQTERGRDVSGEDYEDDVEHDREESTQSDAGDEVGENEKDADDESQHVQEVG